MPPALARSTTPDPPLEEKSAVGVSLSPGQTTPRKNWLGIGHEVLYPKGYTDVGHLGNGTIEVVPRNHLDLPALPTIEIAVRKDLMTS